MRSFQNFQIENKFLGRNISIFNLKSLVGQLITWGSEPKATPNKTDGVQKIKGEKFC